MGMIVDLIIIAIIAISTFLAYQKGVVKLAIGLCSFVIAIAVTFVFYRPIANLVINVTGIDEAIEKVIYEKTNEMMQENKSENEITSQMIEAAKNDMLPETARSLSKNIVTGFVMIILLVGIQIALRFISMLADTIAKLPILDQINKAGGIAYGLIRGILLIYVGLLILSIPGQISPDNKINKSVEQSSIGKMMYENNILTIFF